MSRTLIISLIQIVGLALIVFAAAAFNPVLGVLVGGIALVALGVALEEDTNAP